MTLAERAELLRRGKLATVPASDDDEVVGAWRLAEWTQQVPFTNPAILSERIASLGICDAQFRHLLQAPLAALGGAVPQGLPWVTRLHRAVETASAAGPPSPNTLPSLGVYAFLAPLLHDATERLTREVEPVPSAAADLQRVVGCFTAALLQQLVFLFRRVVALELNVARMHGVVVGESVDEQTSSFVSAFGEPGRLLSLLSEYASAGRLAATLCDQWVANTAELLTRLAVDRARIAEALCGGTGPGDLVHVHVSGVGDRHRGGRSVAILRFSSGIRVVYKPRSLQVDEAFDALVARVNAAGATPPLRTARFLACGEYGWVEFVEAAPCSDLPALQRFYERVGALLCLFYVIDGNDMHMENLIAAGEHPVIVDLETMFHPPLDEIAGWVEGAPAAPETFRRPPRPFDWPTHSVLKVGLLPTRIWARGGGRGVDISGIGGRGGQVVPNGNTVLEQVRDGSIRALRVDGMVAGSENRPELGGAPVDPAEHADAVERGFARMYRALAAEGGRLGHEVIRGFRGCPVRVVLRPTKNYVRLLQESFHPDVLQDALDRDRFFDRLWIEAPHRPILKRVIAFEQASLHRGDVPAFYSSVGTRTLLTEDGDELPDFFTESALDRAADRVRALGERDLDHQCWLIRASMGTLVEAPARVAPVRALTATRQEPVTRERLLAAVLLVAEEVERMELHSSPNAAWPTVARTRSQATVALTLADLYSGLPGVLLFLSAVEEGCGTSRFRELRHRAFCSLRDVLDAGGDRAVEIGAFSGLGGTLYVLDHARRRMPDLDVSGLHGRLVSRIETRVGEEASPGLFDGIAGAVAGLLSDTDGWDGLRRLALARRGAERLVATLDEAHEVEALHAQRGPFAGFALGAAGVAWTLLRTANATGATQLRTRGLQLLEQAWHSRVPDSDPLSLVAPMLQAAAAGDPEWVGRVRTAARATLRHDWPHHALAGGLAQRVEVLSGAAWALGDADAAQLDAATQVLLGAVERREWRCALPLDLSVANLLDGLSGIGLTLLRRAHPELLPSPLGLGWTPPAPPVTTSAAGR